MTRVRMTKLIQGDIGHITVLCWLVQFRWNAGVVEVKVYDINLHSLHLMGHTLGCDSAALAFKKQLVVV